MRHVKKTIDIEGKQCTIVSEPDDRCTAVLIQPTDSHDREELDKEIQYIEDYQSPILPVPFTLVALHIDRWFDELAPWPAPPVFGKTPFGDGAADTLDYINSKLIPFVAKHYGDKNISGDKKGTSLKFYLGGYSLAGLFSLWAATRTAFSGVVAASPSVWYNDWIDYAREHPSLTKRVYLSLGDRESHTKTKIMATVADRIREERDILLSQGVDVVLEMNPGNHFQDNGVRMGKGFAQNL